MLLSTMKSISKPMKSQISMVQDDPNYWMSVVRFSAVNSPLHLTEKLSCDQLPLMLWHWHVVLMFQILILKNKIKNHFSITQVPYLCKISEVVRNGSVYL